MSYVNLTVDGSTHKIDTLILKASDDTTKTVALEAIVEESDKDTSVTTGKKFASGSFTVNAGDALPTIEHNLGTDKYIFIAEVVSDAVSDVVSQYGSIIWITGGYVLPTIDMSAIGGEASVSITTGQWVPKGFYSNSSGSVSNYTGKNNTFVATSTTIEDGTQNIKLMGGTWHWIAVAIDDDLING